MQLRNLDVNELVTNMGRLLERIVGENITVQVDVGPAPLIVHADAGLIDQVLLNLAVNARDAMPHGGRLLIRATAESVAPADRPVTGSADSDEFVNIAVTDTGIGIPDDVLPHMFEPFFTTKDVGKGTGLGLSTAYAIVQQHDGWLDGQSRLGAGSTFTIHLPRQPERAESPSARDEAVAPAGGHETVLVVEDEQPLRMLVSKVLTRAGYRVLEAATGPEALEVWRQHRDRIQVLLTDLVMHDAMSGLDLAKRLREDDPNLVVVYTSGYSAEVAGASGQLQEGVNLLVKPYRPPELLRILRARLDQER